VIRPEIAWLITNEKSDAASVASELTI